MNVCLHTIYGVVCLHRNDIFDGVFLPHVYNLKQRVYMSHTSSIWIISVFSLLALIPSYGSSMSNYHGCHFFSCVSLPLFLEDVERQDVADMYGWTREMKMILQLIDASKMRKLSGCRALREIGGFTREVGIIELRLYVHHAMPLRSHQPFMKRCRL